LLGVSRAALAKVLMPYTNHGKMSSSKRNSGQRPKLSERDHHMLQRIVSNNCITTAAKLMAEFSIHPEDPVSTKTM
jgi:hypothetical protein